MRPPGLARPSAFRSAKMAILGLTVLGLFCSAVPFVPLHVHRVPQESPVVWVPVSTRCVRTGPVVAASMWRADLVCLRVSDVIVLE